MPYNIRTRDGIRLQNIPDDWSPDDPRLKAAVEQRRQQMQQTHYADTSAPPPSFQDQLKAKNPGEYDPTSPEYQAKYGATSAMSTGQKTAANLGAGLTNFGLGTAQLLLPKPAERAVGITDESIDEKRARDEQLAQSETGGKLLQIAGESAPLMAIPGGAVAGQLGKIPALARAGIGSRFLPTLMAESATLGGASGAITPSKSDESVLSNTAMGALGGAVIPPAIAGLGKLARPFIPFLRERGMASKLADVMDVSPQAQAGMAKAIRASQNRVVNAPQSTAALTQNDALARMELAARANADTTAPWGQLDNQANTARWNALDSALGSQATVDTAKANTNAFADIAIPEVMKSMSKGKLAMGVEDLQAATAGMLDKATQKARPEAEQVYSYLSQRLRTSDKSAKALWNIRKTIRDWQEGTPPPGVEGTRAQKIDVPAQEAIGAIDNVLNRASGNKWSKFLDRYSEFAQKETQQKAGQNIRNAFLGEVTGEARTATTKEGAPIVTRAKLAQALETHGKNSFGETLDYPQRNVIDQVMSDLRMDEILQRVKATATGKGGSQTAPLLSLLKQGGHQVVGGKLTTLASWFGQVGRAKQQQFLNQILLEPEDALAVMKVAQNMKRPLSTSEKLLVHGARAALTASQGSIGLLPQQTQQ